MLGALDPSEQIVGGRYALEELIGKGGMGEVWRGRHLALRSMVAIKLLHRASASNEWSRKRFLTEAQVTANLNSRHAVRVFDFGVTEAGIPFLVMELLEGETLDKRISRHGRIPRAETVRLLRQAARALDRAHALGIVHRDFKPENIIVLPDEEGHDEVKVVDFGIAKLMGELEQGARPSDAERGALMTFTRTGNMVGTPYYMAPEQVQDSDQVGAAADIWAFGVVAYECLTGRRPFDDETVPKLLRRILDGEFTPPRSVAPDLPEIFGDWFRAACARDPAVRFRDAQSAVAALAVALDVPLQVAVPPPRESQGEAEASSPGTSGERPALGRSTTGERVARAMAETLDARSAGISGARAELGTMQASTRTVASPVVRRPALLVTAACVVIAVVGWLVVRGVAGRGSEANAVSVPASTAPPSESARAPSEVDEPASHVQPVREPPVSTTTEGARPAPPNGGVAGRLPIEPSRAGAVGSAHAAPTGTTVTSAAPAPPSPPSPPATAAATAAPSAPSPFRLPELGL